MRWTRIFVMVENPCNPAPRYYCAMPAYSYQALDADGKSRSGVLEADTAKSARSLLRSQQLVPLQVQALSVDSSAPGTSRRAWGSRAFNNAQRTVWTRQLAGLVAAGLPLERALSSLAEEAETPAQRDVVATIRTPEVSKRIQEIYFEPVGSSAEQLRQRVASDIAEWTALARSAGLKPE